MLPESRSYQGGDDRRLVHELLRTVAGRLSEPVQCSIGDFEWWQVIDDDPAAIQSSTLWFDDGCLVAFTWPSGDIFDLIVHPDCRDLDAALLPDWIARLPEGAVELTVHTLESDAARAQALEAHGFRSTGRAYDNWVHSLEELPEVLHPEDYVIRALDPDRELESRVAAHRSAFHPSRMSVEKHQRAMASPLYRPDLDLVAVAPDDQIASYALVWFDAVNRKGLFEPVGTHADHRRRGLSRSVISEGLRRLNALGATYAFVNSTAGDVPSGRLYASCGFEVVDGVSVWTRPMGDES